MTDHRSEADHFITQARVAFEKLRSEMADLRQVMEQMSDEELIEWLLSIRDWKK